MYIFRIGVTPHVVVFAKHIDPSIPLKFRLGQGETPGSLDV